MRSFLACSTSAALIVDQLDQDISGCYCCAVANVNCAHDPGFERLDDLGATARNDLARRGRHHIDHAQRRPGQRRAKEGNDRCGDRTTDGRGWRLNDLERRRQEGRHVVAAAFPPVRKRDDVPDDFHCVPACRQWRLA